MISYVTLLCSIDEELHYPSLGIRSMSYATDEVSIFPLLESGKPAKIMNTRNGIRRSDAEKLYRSESGDRRW